MQAPLFAHNFHFLNNVFNLQIRPLLQFSSVTYSPLRIYTYIFLQGIFIYSASLKTMLLRRAKCHLSKASSLEERREFRSLYWGETASSLKGSLSHRYTATSSAVTAEKTQLSTGLSPAQGRAIGRRFATWPIQWGGQRRRMVVLHLPVAPQVRFPSSPGWHRQCPLQQNNRKSLHFAFVSFLLYLYPVYLENFRCQVEHGTWSQD